MARSLWGDLKRAMLDARRATPTASCAAGSTTARPSSAHAWPADPELQAQGRRLGGAPVGLRGRELPRRGRRPHLHRPSTRWDAADTSRRIELQVGRDLQFIRINGTIVGGLAGLAIYTVSQLIT